MKKKTILIAEDNQIVREAIKAIIKEEKEFVLVDEARNGKEALESALKTNPDIIIMDLHMPECNGIDATKLIKNKLPGVEILILTLFNDDEHVIESIQNGASGYLLKDSSKEEFLMALRSISDKKPYFHSEITKNLLDKLTSNGEEKKLNLREKTILKGMAEGINDKSLACQLHLSESTIKSMTRNILKKLDSANRAQAVTKAIKKGLIDIVI
ncbi:MAG: response regulator transcription factor [Actinomycetia bacterium]|nr:response regulator transcription factor [Actinomycetes bacterium]